jgi:hypothetical protein
MQLANGAITISQGDASSIVSAGQSFGLAGYGAKGDGVTDDTAAFNSANAAATASNGTIFVPHGTYIINPSNLNPFTASMTGESMNGTILKIIPGFNATQNLVRVVSASNVVVGNFTLDGNKASVTGGTQYGLFMSTTTNSGAYNVRAQSFTGVGIHYYNNTRAFGNNLYSTGNAYHGLEFEQNTKCTFNNIHGYSNALHGVLVSPGEVNGTGSRGNSFTNVQCDGNSQYGLAFNAANGDVSAWLSEGDVFNNVSLSNNTQYGLNIYKQDRQTFNNLYIANSGFFGVYLFQSQSNNFNNIMMHNNSQAGNGSYDEIMVEGYVANNAHPSTNNVFNGGQIIIDGATKARYAFNEGSSHDGPNTLVNINIPSSGTAGKINQLVANDVISSPGGVVQIGDNGQAIQGANAGFDAAFSHVLRLYNNFPGGVTQVVNPNGSINFYVGGNDVMDITANGTIMQPGVGVASGGASMFTLGGTGLVVSVGSNAPTLSAPQGSLYLRTDGSSSSTRLYVNSNGSTGWVAVTTAS